MLTFRKFIFPFLLLMIYVGCKDNPKNISETAQIPKNSVDIKYAQGFEINDFGSYKTILLKNPWPGTDRTFTYALIKEGASLPNSETFDAVVEIPIKRIVVTSTTHIPSLESLGELESLVGFPNLDYISSEKTRNLINKGEIKELGKNEDLNTEILLDLSPDVVIGFAVDGKNSTFTILQNSGIPVLYNSDWTETSPLGKAEWIKFFGALYNKEELADGIFKDIEKEYLSAKEIATNAKNEPTVISGAMFKDIWYMPEGQSWGAQFIADAKGDYLWKDSKGTGGLSLNLESVMEMGHNAEVWIGPGQFTSLKELENASKAYSQFKAYKAGEVYTYNLKRGEKGGSIYFELAPNRPDIVLKDMIKILHPELLPEHNLYFFSKLK